MWKQNNRLLKPCDFRSLLVRLKGFEPPTYWFVASHSIQLSYSRILPALSYADSLCIIPQRREECK